MHGSGIFTDHARCAGLMCVTVGGINTSSPCTVCPGGVCSHTPCGDSFLAKGGGL